MSEIEQERLRQVFLKLAAERDGVDMSGYSEVELEFGCFIAGYELATARAEDAEAKVEAAEDQLQWSASWLINVPSISFGNDVADGVRQLLELYRAAEADAERLAEALRTNGYHFSYGNGPDMLAMLADVLDRYRSQDEVVLVWMKDWATNLRNKAQAERAALAAHDAKGGE